MALWLDCHCIQLAARGIQQYQQRQRQQQQQFNANKNTNQFYLFAILHTTCQILPIQRAIAFATSSVIYSYGKRIFGNKLWFSYIFFVLFFLVIFFQLIFCFALCYYYDGVVCYRPLPPYYLPDGWLPFLVCFVYYFIFYLCFIASINV